MKKTYRENLPEELIQVVAHAKNIVAFTGAGMSAESGIPTFRDRGGIWDRFDPEEVGTPAGIISLLTRNPEKILSFLKESFDTMRAAFPNPGHIAISELEKLNLLKFVITQNIDNLHSEAGNSNVIELHGNLYRFKCMKCGKKIKYSKSDFFQLAEKILESDKFSIENIISAVPRCSCGGIMRIDVVLFGEPVQDMDRAYEEASRADVMLVVGTSGVVYPAASIPMVAKRHGATIIEINPSTSGFSEIVDWRLEGTSATLLNKLVQMVKEFMLT
jgi:NAD-dependent deacetylase